MDLEPHSSIYLSKKNPSRAHFGSKEPLIIQAIPFLRVKVLILLCNTKGYYMSTMPSIPTFCMPIRRAGGGRDRVWLIRKQCNHTEDHRSETVPRPGPRVAGLSFHPLRPSSLCQKASSRAAREANSEQRGLYLHCDPAPGSRVPRHSALHPGSRRAPAVRGDFRR